MIGLKSSCIPLLTGALVCASVSGQVTQRVSVGSGGAQANAGSLFPAISADGRFVTFQSFANNLVAGDTSFYQDVFVRDRQTGVTERVNVSSSGAEADSISDSGPISADGRFVAFTSLASNLVSADFNGTDDVFVRDRQSGTTERVSVDSSGAEADGDSYAPAISADGRYVAFWSRAINLVPNDTNGWDDVFVRDRQLGTTERVSVGRFGTQGNGFSRFPSISADGRFVAFHSAASNLVRAGTIGTQVFVRDRQAGVTELVSADSAGVQGDNFSSNPFISAGGRYVAFYSFSTNLVPGDSNGVGDVFVRDRRTGTTDRVSVGSAGAQANGQSQGGSLSVDGRYVTFWSEATNLVPGDTNGFRDVFVRDRQSAVTERVSTPFAAPQGNGDSTHCAISADGRYVALSSDATNLIPADTNLSNDIFVRDRIGGTAYTSLCEPGISGVIPCPCANPPLFPGSGCDNSSGTGGAYLAAVGGSYLSSDSLVFSADGEKPTATSIVLQGTASAASGVAYGQGVRCVAGTLKRLFVKTAVGGSITAPDFGAGDPTVSARSAAKGDVIQPGQSRWYLVYYRDPSVLGGCPASSTFNATQTGRVDWSP